MKAILKATARGIAFLVVLPAVVLYRLQALLLPREQAFAGWSQLYAVLPGLTGVYLRWAFYRLVLVRCDTDACIGFGTVFSHPTASLGHTVYVGSYCILGDVTLEDDVLLASGVSIVNGIAQHGIERLDMPIREQPGRWPHITIGRDTWIGERAVIMANVGRHCVIGAGSVVVQPIPDYAIAAGSPAKVLRFRQSDKDSVVLGCDEPIVPFQEED